MEIAVNNPVGDDSQDRTRWRSRTGAAETHDSVGGGGGGNSWEENNDDDKKKEIRRASDRAAKAWGGKLHKQAETLHTQNANLFLSFQIGCLEFNLLKQNAKISDNFNKNAWIFYNLSINTRTRKDAYALGLHSNITHILHYHVNPLHYILHLYFRLDGFGINKPVCFHIFCHFF